ncbi:TPA: N-acetylmuramoyl-L-alanine amidase [Clostridioides difficile]|nr:N-acetylmuramoyl-L-alanine amidase [Clostridioides difficile]EKS6825105.1 N-acetylmuramoyl-L-alanine amidase [Clostridioides difficile]MBY2485737.1 N-acetylmuramoyl-L-alanine amidase [Clostridioides difficile]MCW0565054.1 N-acetylmuramoyl-L-alanine amidase [Clostridioides difficile]MCZ8510021.1 N-acetylmuramoyl-L-alanine amidase [Clostridioides difficile]
MKICITVGHSILKGGLCTSANGVVNEYQYCKMLSEFLVKILKAAGCTVDVIICPERQFTSKIQERAYKLPRINGKKYDLVIELHLNSYNGSAKGTEVLYCSNTGKMYAQRVVNKLGTVFTSRGVKDRPDLYMLNSTDCPAIMIETFFCDSKNDYDIATKLGYESVAKLIAEGVLNKSITTGSDNKMKKNCVLYSNDADKTIAEVFAWSKQDCVVMDVKDFRSYTTENLFVVGGKTEESLKAKKLPDRYTVFNGVDRWNTLDKVLNSR